MGADVVILTGISPGLGQGHIQRMSSLLWGLRENRGIDAKMKVDPRDGGIPTEMAPHLTDDIGSPKLIIRDMRDSGHDEIAGLGRIAPVCVIDDRGAGRKTAAYAVDIMPHPEGSSGAIEGPFLFGYNFLRSIQSLRARSVKTRADFVVYAGALDDDGAARLESLLPENTSRYILGKGLPMHRAEDGTRKAADEGYAEMILSSRVAVTHFGVFLYEAAVAGCGLVTVNPSAYHSVLADLAKRSMPLRNTGVFGELDDDAITRAIVCALEETVRRVVRCDDVEARAVECINRFADLIVKML